MHTNVYKFGLENCLLLNTRKGSVTKETMHPNLMLCVSRATVLYTQYLIPTDQPRGLLARVSDY
jgi:hypothetical protein